MYTLDTDTLIYFFKGKGKVADQLLAVAPKDIGVSLIVVYEIEVGIQKTADPSQRKKQWEEFLNTCRVLPFDRKEISAAAKIRSQLEKRGEPIGPLDTLIAGTALANDLTLVTHNVREFKKVEGLKIMDWF